MYDKIKLTAGLTGETSAFGRCLETLTLRGIWYTYPTRTLYTIFDMYFGKKTKNKSTNFKSITIDFVRQHYLLFVDLGFEVCQVSSWCCRL